MTRLLVEITKRIFRKSEITRKDHTSFYFSNMMNTFFPYKQRAKALCDVFKLKNDIRRALIIGINECVFRSYQYQMKVIG